MCLPLLQSGGLIYMKYKFAVIGYGFIGRRHVNTLKSFAESDCTAVCDINPTRLDEVKALYPDMEVYDNADDLFAKADIDGVIISANNNQHKELAIKAAKAGKHIICEKPAAMSVAELDEYDSGGGSGRRYFYCSSAETV